MKKGKLGRPSPAMIVALVALFAALGGSAYAASTIGTKQIKNGAITAAKLKKEAVTAAKIRNGAITGAKLDLSQLGTVPNASHATSADTAAGAGTAGHAKEADKATEAIRAGEADHAKSADTASTAAMATNFSRYFTTGLVHASIGQEAALWQAGPFTATGVCRRNGNGEVEAITYLTTSAAHSTMASYSNAYYPANFEPGEEPTIGSRAESKGPEVGEYQGTYYYDGFQATSPDARYLLSGTAVNAVNLYGSDCAFFDEFHNAG